jgi:hypothetical protein
MGGAMSEFRIFEEDFGDDVVFVGAEPSITCPRCRRTSYHPGDIVNFYCGYCHWPTSDPHLGAPDIIARLEADGMLPPC